MPRIAKPRKWRDKYVTEAGGKMKVLCSISQGMTVARKKLAKYLAELEQEKEHRRQGNHSARTIAQCAAELIVLTPGQFWGYSTEGTGCSMEVTRQIIWRHSPFRATMTKKTWLQPWLHDGQFTTEARCTYSPDVVISWLRFVLKLYCVCHPTR